MTDLSTVLPHFATGSFAHILPSLDRSQITISDVLTLDAIEVARRATVPTVEVQKFADAILSALHGDLKDDRVEHLSNGNTTAAEEETSFAKNSELGGMISSLDAQLDVEFSSGVPTGYITEITGESGVGKTQFLLTLLLAVQLPPPHGVSKSAVYISTEATLATSRLSQLLDAHPQMSLVEQHVRPSLSRVLSIQTPDLESQDHILRYQLPVAIERHNIGLVVIDSIAANYRAEFEKGENKQKDKDGRAAGLAKRSALLVQLGAHLRELARTKNIAIVVANQVADRFSPIATVGASQASSISASRTTSNTSTTSGMHLSQHSAPDATPTQQQPNPPLLLTTSDPLTLDHQQRWFTGWGDGAHYPYSHANSLKTPSLGLIWANQIACRIALIKAPVYRNNYSNKTMNVLQAIAEGKSLAEAGDEDQQIEIVRWRRWMKVAFAPWTAPSEGRGVEFKITQEGLKGVRNEEDEGKT